jgi:hypothetical protein
MVHGKPITIANELIAKIGALISEASEYADPQDFAFKVLSRDAEKLANADGYAASIARAMLANLAGNRDATSHWLRNAEKWPGTASDVRWAEIVMLSNLGYFTEAASLFHAEPTCVPAKQTFINLAFLLAAFQLLLVPAKGTAIAEEVNGHPDLALAKRCDMALNEMKVSEAHVRAVLDLAGEVLRKHNVFFIGEAPLIRTVPDGVLYQLRVKAAPQELTVMTDEVITSMVAKDLDAPGLAFRFIPA